MLLDDIQSTVPNDSSSNCEFQLGRNFGGPHGTKYTDVDIVSPRQGMQVIRIRAEERINFKTFYENQWGERLKCLLSDNGTEYVNKKVAEVCSRNGIMHQRMVLYSLQKNGVEEMMNSMIMEKARSMVHYKGVSTLWWAEAVNTAVYLINCSTNTANSRTTSYELGFKTKPRMDHLRVLRTQGCAHVDDAKRTKLEPKNFRCMFLGYAENVKRYRVYDLDASKIMVSRSVQLDEREVNGIYDTHVPKPGTVTYVTKDSDVAVVPVQEVQQLIPDEPMEEVEEPV
ncbi:polyprotein [Phytophthora megakarya]|uniref:Polyprotein n=1 Tax=Phytophthora megakarya TaxID=4795 RepID=A0A225VVA2_9STRA|nr:polyprotein [Phytophthora megakarya]